MPPSQQQQIDALRAEIVALGKRQDDADAMRIDTHNKVSDMHRALMEPQIGQGSKSLLDRMAEVTIEIESGKMVGKRIVFIAQVCAAVGVVAAFAYAAVNFGAPK
jgi:hypothetical protein